MFKKKEEKALVDAPKPRYSDVWKTRKIIFVFFLIYHFGGKAA